MNLNNYPTHSSVSALAADRVFCHAEDGTLKVHHASVTCDVCRKAKDVPGLADVPRAA